MTDQTEAARTMGEEQETIRRSSPHKEILRWLVSGAAAGLAVDLTVYPLDTLKTRMQSRQGFHKAGGYRDIYRGLSSVLTGSAPNSALFFFTYSAMKQWLAPDFESVSFDALRASVSEVVALVVRVPTEVVKQRAQVSFTQSSLCIAKEIHQREGLKGFYRGFRVTLYREIPFAFIELPLWEHLKRWRARRQGRACTPFESALMGTVAGCVAAFVTNPIDVAKTRIMLMEFYQTRASDGRTKAMRAATPSMLEMLRQVYREGGVRRLWAGAMPRTTWLAGGGFVYFYGFEAVMKLTHKLF